MAMLLRGVRGASCLVGVVGSMLALSACGGGGGDAGSGSAGLGPDVSQRASAASATALSGSNACAAIRPFYWEIGDAQAARASGSVGTGYDAGTVMNIASASKWLYGAYVAQVRNGVLSASDISALSFRSGYTDFSFCLPGQTVGQCAAYQNNAVLNPAHLGFFYYSGGHMQQHAAANGLAGLGNAALATEMRRVLGPEIAMTYSQPQLAGGVVTNAANYAIFLRKLLSRELVLGHLLGSSSVCTNRVACPGEAVYSPAPLSEVWRYSVGHWVETDPQVGDGAFSSAGAFGFYPWIDAGRTHYGIVSREAAGGSGFDSATCGRLIRKAWLTATPQ